MIRNGADLLWLNPTIPTILLGDPYIYRGGWDRTEANFALEILPSIHCWTLYPFSSEFGHTHFFFKSRRWNRLDFFFVRPKMYDDLARGARGLISPAYFTGITWNRLQTCWTSVCINSSPTAIGQPITNLLLLDESSLCLNLCAQRASPKISFLYLLHISVLHRGFYKWKRVRAIMNACYRTLIFNCKGIHVKTQRHRVQNRKWTEYILPSYSYY